MTVHSAPTATPLPAPTWHRLVRRWPSALGLGVAIVVLGTGAAETATLAITAPAAAFCYLAAAALGRPWVAWPMILGAVLVVVAGELAGLPWWAALGLTGLALTVLGVVRGTSRTALDAQVVALVAFGAAGVLALSVPPRAAVLVAGIALATHSVWDAVHYRRNVVVSRSLAEACMLLDAPLGLGFIVLALT